MDVLKEPDQSSKSGSGTRERTPPEKCRTPGDQIFRAGCASEERRTAPRVLAALPVYYKLFPKDEDWEQGRLLDISSTGAKLRIKKSVRLRGTIQVYFHPPESPEGVCADGIIVRTKPDTAGRNGIECGIFFAHFREIPRHQEPLYCMPDRLCDLVLKYTPLQMECRSARTLDEIREAYQLVYQEYLASGYCRENVSGLHYTSFSILPESRTFLILKDKRLLGTLSLIPDSPCGLPMESAFPDCVRSLRRADRRIAEAGLFTLDRGIFHGRNLALTHFHKLTGCFWLFKTMLDYARTCARITDLLIAVHPKHENLYRNLAFKPVAVRESYAGAHGKPALAMHLDVERLKKNLSKTCRFHEFFFGCEFPPEWFKNSFQWTDRTLNEWNRHAPILRSKLAESPQDGAEY